MSEKDATLPPASIATFDHLFVVARTVSDKTVQRDKLVTAPLTEFVAKPPAKVAKEENSVRQVVTRGKRRAHRLGITWQIRTSKFTVRQIV